MLLIIYTTKYFEFYLEVLNLFENCLFFDKRKKNEILKIKSEVIKQRLSRMKLNE